MEAIYATTGVKKYQFPDDGRKEIALAGRSNVGKSSLINRLVNRKNLARISSKPGKTQAINFYLINRLFYFADVPGYGFARVPKSIQASWKKMMEAYLINRSSLKAIIQIVDLRHSPTVEDLNMHEFLLYHQIPVILVATKADKISKGKWQTHLKVIRKKVGLEADKEIILFSSKTGYGTEDILKRIEEFLSE
jgi:GTP-binding protein